ncbi:MAG: class I SAM-dependent methyltransferase, partial [Syntrophales bacterium]|nr:class I SAM-dependent methyltransferase [Syntrophales bacterium]
MRERLEQLIDDRRVKRVTNLVSRFLGVRKGVEKPGILTEIELRTGRHRQWVGGDWERKGKIQIDFLRQRGLMPHHRLLDVGCGVLRGGLHFMEYLDSGNYYGIEARKGHIEAGRWEIEQARLGHKNPHLLVNDAFEVERFGTTFDYAIAVSLFT